jgi:hypothetical protein
MKNRVCCDHRENPRRSVNRKAVPLAKMKQSRQRIDVAAQD